MATKLTTVIVGFATLLYVASYLVFLCFVGTVVAIAAHSQGLDPFGLSGSIVFLAVVLGELATLFLLDKPAPILITFSLPFILGEIVVHQAISSEAIKRVIRIPTETIRNPPFLPHSLLG